MRWKRWAVRITALTVAALLAFLVGWVPWFLGGVATTRRFQFPDRENAGLTPASFDLAFEEMRFGTEDGLGLTGWWVPVEGARGSVVLVHGLNRTRIEMVKKLPFLHERGWNALLFDLRHHGDSEGDVSSFGYFERRDVAAAVREARTRSPGPVVVWGVSLGGASAVLAAAADQAIAGVICDSSFRSLRDTVAHHLVLARSWRWWLRIVPQWPVGDAVVFWIGQRGGFDPDAVDIEAAAAQLGGRPTLFVANSDDRRMPREIAFDLQAAVGESAQVLMVPGKSHGGAYRDGRAAYEHAATQVLEAAAPRVEQEPPRAASETEGLDR